MASYKLLNERVLLQRKKHIKILGLRGAIRGGILASVAAIGKISQTFGFLAVIGTILVGYNPTIELFVFPLSKYSVSH